VIRAVLFDMGGVLVTSPFAGFDAYERAAGLPSGLIRRINATDPDSNAWSHFERGAIDRDTFLARFEAEAARLGHTVDGAQVLAALAGTVIEEMLVAVDRVRAVARTGLLTNNLRPMDNTSPIGAQLVPRFDVIVQSAVEGIRKPDPEFYRRACERLAVAPDECVFLDDLGINCKPARAMGMTTIKVTDANEALEELELILGTPLRE
jgi:putative hydrolase of the HAD superfamily